MLIGLNGLKNSGKDTVGAYLEDQYGFERASFAAKLKESAAALFNVTPGIWEELKNNPNSTVTLDPKRNNIIYRVTVREFLQRYGTEAHRDIFGANFWVDHALKGIDRNKNIVFTDARFENELQKIKSLGGYNLQILRPQLFTEDSHVSEVPPPRHLIDYAVDNSGSFEFLYNQVDNFIEFIDLEFVSEGSYNE